MIYQSPRPPALRAAAMTAVTGALVDAYGLQPDQVQVYFHEVPDDRWGRAGLASERAAEAAREGQR